MLLCWFIFCWSLLRIMWGKTGKWHQINITLSTIYTNNYNVLIVFLSANADFNFQSNLASCISTQCYSNFVRFLLFTIAVCLFWHIHIINCCTLSSSIHIICKTCVCLMVIYPYFLVLSKHKIVFNDFKVLTLASRLVAFFNTRQILVPMNWLTYCPLQYHFWTLSLVPNLYQSSKNVQLLQLFWGKPDAKILYQNATCYWCMLNTKTLVSWNRPPSTEIKTTLDFGQLDTNIFR